MTVGDIVYVVPIEGSNSARCLRGPITNYIKEYVVNKVGRKYFYVGNWDKKFNFENMEDEINCSGDYKAYINKQDIFDEIEYKDLEKTIRDKFYHNSGLTLEELREINAIINKPY